MRLAVAGSALLVAAGLAAFWYTSGVARKAPPKAADNAVTVTIQGNVCQPNEITVPAGRTTFTIVNQSSRALEWEILDGVMVVEERENIAPGFSQTMTVKLPPGEFDITCGLLSNPRGKLRVTPSAASDAEAARPSLVNYVGALAEYRVFLALEAGSLQDATQALADAIQAGDLKQAQALYAPAHQAYKRIEPMAELFADVPESVENTLRIAERCTVELPKGENHAPLVKVRRVGKAPAFDPAAPTAWFNAFCAGFELEPFDGISTGEKERAAAKKACDQALRDLAEAGALWRYGKDGVTPEVRARRQRHLQLAEASFEALPFDAAAARAFGSVSASLRSHGRKTSARAFDALIAATALADGLPL